MKYASSSVTGLTAAGRSSIGVFVLRASSSIPAALINSFSRSPVIIQSVSRNWPASVSRLLRRLVFAETQQIRKQPISSRHTLGQLPIQRQSDINISALACLRHQQPALLRILLRIMHLERSL